MKELAGCFRNHDFFLIYLKIEPAFDGLHDNPGFQDMVRRIGL